MIQIDRKIKPVQYSKRVEPTMGLNDPRFKWSTGADVKATWARFGFKPFNANDKPV